MMFQKSLLVHYSLCVVGVLVITAADNEVIAGDIPIRNPSFELQSIPDGTWIGENIIGWTVTGLAGVQNWTDTQFLGANDGDSFPSSVPGTNSAYLRGDASGSISQVVGTLSASTEYTLQAQIGNRLDGGFANYRAQLLAGTTVIAQDLDSLSPAHGDWEPTVVRYRSPSTSSLIGQPLSVRFETFGNQVQQNAPGYFQTIIDDVSLDFTSIPRFDQSNPPPKAEVFKSRLPESTGAENLVLLIHGWRSGPDVWPDDDEDGKNMKAAIEERVGSDWEVVAYDWKQEADFPLSGLKDSANKALTNAIIIGSEEGKVIARRDYEHVHLVAHSAGSGMATAIARRLQKDSDASVHITLLDAYAPSTYFLDSHGSHSDFTDHYYTREAFLGETTDRPLPNAHDIDVSLEDDGFNNHGFPVDFYLKTIQMSTPNPAWGDYGFGLSKEILGDNWNPQSMYFNDKDVVLLGATPPHIGAVARTLHAPLDPSSLTRIDSSTGTVSGPGTTLLLTTGVIPVEESFDRRATYDLFQSQAPAKQDPVWVVLEVNLPEESNFFTLDASLLEGEEVLLSIYFDDLLVGYLDDDQWNSTISEFEFGLPELSRGFHTVALRLDSDGATSASVRIESLQFGVVVPEAPSFFLCLAGAGICVALPITQRRCRERNAS